LILPPYIPGQFVWCLFPFSEEPGEPGLKEHIGYIADIRRKQASQMTMMMLYTTSRQWNPDVPQPLGILPVNQDQARTMGQDKPFVVDARRIAFLPVTPSFFPRLMKPGNGIAGVAPKSFQQNVQNVLAELVRRPDLIQITGPKLT